MFQLCFCWPTLRTLLRLHFLQAHLTVKKPWKKKNLGMIMWLYIGTEHGKMLTAISWLKSGYCYHDIHFFFLLLHTDISYMVKLGLCLLQPTYTDIKCKESLQKIFLFERLGSFNCGSGKNLSWWGIILQECLLALKLLL